MKCYHCDYENNEDAIFCKSCGQRVDGKVECNHCKRLIDYDSQFCEFCGASTQDEETYYAEKESYTGFSRKAIIQRSAGETGCRMFTIVATLLSLFFTFFIGISYNTNVEIDTTSSIASMQSMNLYYFFGDIYEQISLLKNMTPDFMTSHLYFFAIFGTILAIAIMLAVVAFAITTLVLYVKNITGKSEKSYLPSAIATYISYVLGVALFCAYYGSNGSGNSYYSFFKSNLYSVLGLVFSTIAIAIAIICKTLSQGKLLYTQRSASKISFSSLSILLLVLLSAMATTLPLTMQMSSGTASYNYFNALSAVAIAYASKSPTLSPVTGLLVYPEVPVNLYITIVIALILQTAIVIMSMILITKYLKNLTSLDENNFSGLITGIVLLIISIAYMILAINIKDRLIEYIDSTDDSISIDITLPIVIAAISAVYTIITIINTISKKLSRE